VNKLIQWLKSMNQNANARAKMIMAARDILACMDTHWQEAGKSNDAVATLLIKIGLFNIQAIYQGQLAAQNVIRSRKAHLN
jgi:hypothetical protein